MNFVRLFLLFSLAFCFSGFAEAQEPSQTVPHLVNFSGHVIDDQGKTMPGISGITFAIYKTQYDGSPLWMETQNVQLDARGSYTVHLGATQSAGLPLELFTSGEARWLGVQVNGQEEQPRVVLLSVPYALKAADAATIGGLPPSAFLLAPSGNTASSSGAHSMDDNFQPALGGNGTLNFVPLWTPDGNTLGNSVLFQSGTGSTAQIGINTTTPASTLDVNGPVIARGVLQLLSTGTATAGGGFSSQPLYLQGSAFNSSTQQAINPVFEWQTEAAGNNSANPSGTLNLLFGSGSNAPGETGLNIAGNGKITFATGQTFPGTGTITGITAGTGLSGGGNSGNVTLSINVPFANQFYAQLGAPNTFTKNQTVNANVTAKQLISTATQGTAPLQVTSTTQVSNLNASLLAGLTPDAFQPAGSYAGLGANTFTGDQNVNGNVTANAVNVTTSFNLAGARFASGSFSNANALLGFAGNSTMTGTNNTATGAFALVSNTTGSGNTAAGEAALAANTSGGDNTATGSGALQENTSGDGNTATGDAALASNTTGADNTATGTSALQGNTTGGSNTAEGVAALANNTTGAENTAVGIEALRANTSGNFNTALGAEAGQTTNRADETGSGNTFLGAVANSGTQTNLTNATAIGAFAQVTANNAMILGSVSGVNGANADTSIGIGTTAPTAKLDVRGTANFTGLITFAPNQSFPGTGTITGVSAGTDLVGGGSTGNVTLNVDTTKVVTTVNAGNDLLGGGTGGVVTINLDTGKVPQLGANTYSGTQTISLGDLALTKGNLSLPPAGVVKLGAAPFIFASDSSTANTTVGLNSSQLNAGSENTALGALVLQVSTGIQNTANGAFALSLNSTGSQNTGLGAFALEKNTTGSSNTAVGEGALNLSSTGSHNTAVGNSALLATTASQNTALGFDVMQNYTTGSNNTAVGASAGNDPTGHNISGSNDTFLGANANPGTQTNLSNATAIGASAEVTASNAMVLGSINGVNNATADTNVGIGVTNPSHKLHVGVGNNAFRVEGPAQGTPSPILASFGGTGDFRIDAVGAGGGRFVVKDSGLVGINTTAPDATLSVNGSADKPGGGSWATFSDLRLKNLDGNFNTGLAQVLKLHPVRYRYKAENALGIQDHELHVGFVAQDVQKVIPEAVTKNSRGYLLVNNDPILWTMLNAIQEQQRQIDALRAQLQRQPSPAKSTIATATSMGKKDKTIRNLRSQVKQLKTTATNQTRSLQRLAAQMVLLEARLAGVEQNHAQMEVATAAVAGHQE